MKKLLAMVLCVMMFVSVLSASAFAATTTPFQKTWQTESVKYWQDMLGDIREVTEHQYQILAADKALFGALVAVDDFVVDFVDGMLDKFDFGNLTAAQIDALYDAQEWWMAEYMAWNMGQKLTKLRFSNAKWATDPLGNLNKWVEAINYSFGQLFSAKNVAELQTIFAGAAAKSAIDDLHDAFTEWVADMDPDDQLTVAIYSALAGYAPGTPVAQTPILIGGYQQWINPLIDAPTTIPFLPQGTMDDLAEYMPKALS